jgi:guanosine-3',5'-bis(diphosphate) 3'-pyrophosphohydrolase
MSEYNLSLEEENREILRQYRKLISLAKPVLKDDDAKVIKKAFTLAAEAHNHMRRKSGEPYIFHPIAVAQICVEEIGLGTTSIVAALLHDVVEDTDYTLEDIEKRFGRKVARIIDGLTKISDAFSAGGSQQAENFRKLVLTLSEDVRVILVKLADRLHNMRTLESMPRHKQLKIASETIYMFAPLAHRLGLYSIKTEFEDLYLKYTDPTTYIEIKNKVSASQGDRSKFIRDFIRPIQSELRKERLEFSIKGRPKSIYSIWTKMKNQNVPFEQVYDLFAVRIIVDAEGASEKSVCWNVYSAVTDFYKPNPDRLRDWISTPKGNGYESLHTTVMSEDGKWVEVQIRTKRMDEIAEKGYAAHWKYKDKDEEKKKKQSPEAGLDLWISKVRASLEQTDTSALEFVDEFRTNLFKEEIFVFTPTGDLKVLQSGSTILDLAFEIHSDLGFKCIGGKINHKLVPNTHQLKNGDQVEVLSSEQQVPMVEWLSFVKTSRARRKIKEFLNEGKRKVIQRGREFIAKINEASTDGKVISEADIRKLAKYYHLHHQNDLLLKLGHGEFSQEDIIHLLDRIYANKKHDKTHAENEALAKIKSINKTKLVIGKGVREVTYHLSDCCQPIPGDDVFGYVASNGEVEIHRTNCKEGTKLMSNYGYRIVKAEWTSEKEKEFLSGIKITGTDRRGLLSDITMILSNEFELDIKSINADTKDGIIEDYVTMYVKDTDHLDLLSNKMMKIAGVIGVERFDPNI